MTSRTRVIILFAVAATACRPSSVPEREGASPVPVTTAAATVRQAPRIFEAGGVVRAWTTAALASRITAPVVTVHVNAGDRVRRGQPLVTLDGRDLAANQLRAASEAAALERAQAAAMANRAAAEAELGLARTSHARIATLHAHDAATTQELDEAASALQVAEARVTAAEAQASAAAASLAAARQAESAARAAASYAVLTAPVDGLITERLVDPGALATPGTPLLRIDNTSRFRLEVLVDASRLDSVAPGDAVEIAFGDSDGVEAPAVPMVRGTVSEIARAIDASSHSFLVKIDLPADVTLRSGMFGRVRFAGASQNLLTLPAAALVPQGQLSTVFVVSADRRAQMRVIDVGLRTPDWVEVLAGVSAGERVILSPTRVRDGVPVRDTGSGVRQ